VTGFCKHGIEPSGFIKGGGAFLDLLRVYCLTRSSVHHRVGYLLSEVFRYEKAIVVSIPHPRV
jgi:hypothetical protein